MRTTLSIDDHLLSAAKRRARERGKTLGQVVEDALRREIATGAARAPGPVVPVFRDGTGPREAIDLTSNRALREALDEDVALDHLR